MERTRVKELAERREEEAARRKVAPRRGPGPRAPEAERPPAWAAAHAGVGNGVLANTNATGPLRGAESDDVLALHSAYGNRLVTRAAETFASPTLAPLTAHAPASETADTPAPTSPEGLREAERASLREAERAEESGEPEYRRAVEVEGGSESGAAEVKGAGGEAAGA